MKRQVTALIGRCYAGLDVADLRDEVLRRLRRIMSVDAAFFGTSTLRLAPVVKEQYLGFVDREHPDLLERYERAYPGRSAPEAYQQALGLSPIRSRKTNIGNARKKRRPCSRLCRKQRLSNDRGYRQL